MNLIYLYYNKVIIIVQFFFFFQSDLFYGANFEYQYDCNLKPVLSLSLGWSTENRTKKFDYEARGLVFKILITNSIGFWYTRRLNSRSFI